MAKYRKKPVEIEAYHFAERENKCPAWFVDAVSAKTLDLYPDHILIRTLEGTMRADRGDWIIRGVRGELYPCKPDIFAATYESVVAPEKTEVELKPCPFCGGTALLSKWATTADQLGGANIECPCHASLWGFSADEVVEAWNDRAPPSAPASEDAEPTKGDLVERLRGLAAQTADGTDFHKGRALTAKDTLYWVAADAIARLTAELKAAQETNARLTQRMFPIMGGPAIPWTVIAPCEWQAHNNHGQTLERLAERGGLGIGEAIDVLTGRRCATTQLGTIEQLLAIVKEREANPRAEALQASLDETAILAETQRDRINEAQRICQLVVCGVGEKESVQAASAFLASLKERSPS